MCPPFYGFSSRNKKLMCNVQLQLISILNSLYLTNEGYKSIFYLHDISNACNGLKDTRVIAQ